MDSGLIAHITYRAVRLALASGLAVLAGMGIGLVAALVFTAVCIAFLVGEVFHQLEGRP